MMKASLLFEVVASCNLLEVIMRLNGKTALITGGNSGIGLATARAFVREGARVAITGRNQDTLDEAVRALGPNALAFRADIMDSAASEAAIRTAAERFGHLDIVVANAGIAGNTAVGSTTSDQFEQIMSTNVTGVFPDGPGCGAVFTPGRVGDPDRFSPCRAGNAWLFSLRSQQGCRARDGPGAGC